MSYLIGNASEARVVAQQKGGAAEELNEVLTIITEAVFNGKLETYIYKSLKDITLDALVARGFDIKHMDGLAVQKDNVYYKITW